MNTTARSSFPLVPDDLRPNAKCLVRVAAAHAIAAARGSPPYQPAGILRELWPHDHAALALIERAATGPATTTAPGWADTLAGRGVEALIGSLRDSAAAVLIARAPKVDLTGAREVRLPYASSTGTAAWVAEGAPIPAGAGTIAAGGKLEPRKLALLASMTRETFEGTGAASENWMEIVLRDSATAALDATLFSSTAGDSVRPPGLVAGIAPIAAAVGGGMSAVITDFGNLTDAIAAGGGGGEIYYFASPGRSVAAKGYLPALAPRIFGSAAIPSTQLMAVATGAFASAWDPVPDIAASKEAVIHYEGTTPLHIGTPGAPDATIAAPSRSLFQTDVVAWRLILKCGFGLRIPGAAAWIGSGLSW